MNPLNSLSLTLIVKNEEAHLDNVLANVHIFADEIVIVDTGSTDRTKEIASKYTDKIVDFVWVNDFARARNFGIGHCTKDFVMWLDADDTLSVEDAQKIRAIKEKPIEWDVLYMQYDYARDANGNTLTIFPRERIFRNRKGYKFIHPIHEFMETPDAKSEYANDITVVHNKLHAVEQSGPRNMEILLKAVEQDEYKNDFRIWSYLARDSEPQKAVVYYRKILSDLCGGVYKPFHSEAYVNYGRKLMTLGQPDEALEAFGKGIVIYPLWREPFFFAAQAFSSQKRYDEALKMLWIAGDIPPPEAKTHITFDPNIYDREHFYDWLYFVYHCMGNVPKMKEIAELALTKIPDSKLFLSRRAELA